MRSTDEHDDVDLQGWLAGDWPALFVNKPHSSILAANDPARDNSHDWYIRCQALDVMLDAGMGESPSALDAIIDQIAAMAADETKDGGFREMTAMSLLGFPRQRHRTLLEGMAEGEAQQSN